MIKVHAGCGERNFGDDWIHVDADYSLEHVTHHDIFLKDFDNESVDLIYACHVIEYFDREQVKLLLKDWLRVLKHDGILRLAVPDFDILSGIYTKCGGNLDLILGPLYGKWLIKNEHNIEYYIYHKTIYNYYSLYKLLGNVGFININLWNWRQVDHGKFDDYSQAYIPHMDKENGTLISLNIEATKP